MPRHGVARLERCANPRLALLGRWITDLSSCQLDADTQRQVQDALADLAWMNDHGVRYAGHDALEHLEKLQQLLAVRDSPLAKLEGVRCAMQSYVRHVLTQASQVAQGPPADDYANAWSLALAKLLLNADGTCDATALATLRTLVDSDEVAWLPARHWEDFLVQVTGLIGKPWVLEKIDQISGIHPVHPSVHALLKRRAFPGEGHPRRILALHVLQTAFTAPLQGSVDNCWPISHNRNTHFRWMVLEHLAVYLNTGVLEFVGREGAVDAVEPDPYPTVVMDLCMRPGDAKTYLRCEDGFVRALQEVFPNAKSDLQWRTELRKQCNAEGIERGPVPFPMRVVLDRAVAAQLGLAVRYLSGVVPPADDESKERSAQHPDLVWACLLAWEAQHVNPLASAWHTAISKYATDSRLRHGCWGPIEKALRAEMLASERPEAPTIQSVESLLSVLRDEFLSCAMLHLDHDASLIKAQFRLFIRPKGTTRAEGRGVPVRNGRELIAWLERMAQQAVQEPELSALLLAIHSPRFLASVEEGGGPRKDRPRARGMWWVDTHLAGRGHLGVAPSKTGSDAASHDHHPEGTDLHFGFYAGPQAYVVAASIDMPADKRPEWTLMRLIRQWRSLDAGRFPEFSLQDHLNENHGVAVWAVNRLHGGHAFTWMPQHPSVQAAWKAGESPRKWIRTALKRPMRRLLNRRLTPEKAQAWLTAVLNGCRLKPHENVVGLVAELMRLARSDADASPRVTLKALVTALDQLSARGSDNPFEDADPRHNGLDVAIQNALPGQVPCAVYAHSNWSAAPALFYGVNARTGEIDHYFGIEQLGAHGDRRCVVLGHKEPYLW